MGSQQTARGSRAADLMPLLSYYLSATEFGIGQNVGLVLHLLVFADIVKHVKHVLHTFAYCACYSHAVHLVQHTVS